MAEIRLEDVTKRFGKTVVVDQINLTAADKEFLVLVGPSGCGKSTTLRMIAGLEDVTEGEIYIGERPVRDVHPKDRDIAMVFQNYALYPHMTIYDNIAFGLRFKKVARREIDGRVKETAKILGIDQLLNRKPKDLSGGQRQRAAMGRAIVRQPQAFLFDEPLSNLDAKLRVHMRGELVKLHQRLETTIVYVTHDQVEAMTMADRIVIMNEGIIQQMGPPMEVYNHPGNFFVAGFIGSPTMNFWEGRLVEEDGTLLVKGVNLKLCVPEKLRARFMAAKDRDIIFGIRPERIYTSQFRHLAAGAQPLRAKVVVVEPLGNTVNLLAISGDVQFTASVDPESEVRPREEMEFYLDMNWMHIFDKSTGAAY